MSKAGLALKRYDLCKRLGLHLARVFHLDDYCYFFCFMESLEGNFSGVQTFYSTLERLCLE